MDGDEYGSDYGSEASQDQQRNLSGVRDVLKFYEPEPSLQPELSVFGKLYLFLDRSVTPNTHAFLNCPNELSAAQFARLSADPDLSLKHEVLADRLGRGLGKALTQLRVDADVATMQRCITLLVRTWSIRGRVP